MCGVVKPLRAESANASPNCLLSIRSAGLAWTQHGNPEANIARCSREDRRRPSHQSDRRSNAMATIKRTLIQLLSPDAYARGAAYPSGWLVRPGCQTDTSDGMLTEALMPRCLGPVAGWHGEVAQRSGLFNMEGSAWRSSRPERRGLIAVVRCRTGRLTRYSDWISSVSG
jgi:hypothetical protein